MFWRYPGGVLANGFSFTDSEQDLCCCLCGLWFVFCPLPQSLYAIRIEITMPLSYFILVQLLLLLGWWIGPHSWNLINFLLKHIILHWIFWIVLQILNCISTKLIKSSKKSHLCIIENFLIIIFIEVQIVVLNLFWLLIQTLH